MEFSKFEVSRNFGFKHRQEQPLEISTWPSDYHAYSISLPAFCIRKVVE
jgi:hypothetical protein